MLGVNNGRFNVWLVFLSFKKWHRSGRKGYEFNDMGLGNEMTMILWPTLGNVLGLKNM